MIILFLMTVLLLQSAEEMQSGSAEDRGAADNQLLLAIKRVRQKKESLRYLESLLLSESSADSEFLLCFQRFLHTHESLRHLESVFKQKAHWIRSEFVPDGVTCGDKQHVALLNNLDAHVKCLVTELSELKEVHSLDGLIEEEEEFQYLSRIYNRYDSGKSSDQRYKHGVGKDKKEVVPLCRDDRFQFVRNVLERFKVVFLPVNKHPTVEDLIGVWENCKEIFVEYSHLHMLQTCNIKELSDSVLDDSLRVQNQSLLKEFGFCRTLTLYDFARSCKHTWKDRGLRICRAELESLHAVVKKSKFFPTF
ncbi:MAG: hypothetical protein OXC30_02980 [Alphaproteobacteria bacterium]|nr:hypothetical protein [Alphaproteobacteria bacterium]